MTTTPNMNLPVPVPTTTSGPTWAQQLVADMDIIDAHDHTSGNGVQITPDGLNINSNLPIGGNKVTGAGAVEFSPQNAALTDLEALYVVGQDLYYTDGAGNQVRITQSGSVTGSSGTITGLPSGTASAAFSTSTFTFQSATNTPAIMAVGPLVIGRNAVSPKTVTVTPNASQSADYGLTLPQSLPSSTLPVTVDTSGNVDYGPILTSNTFTPTISWSHISGGTASFSVTGNTSYYTRIGSIVTVSCNIVYTVSSYSGSTAVYYITSTIPIATSSLTAAGTFAFDISTFGYGPLFSSGTTLVTSQTNLGVNYGGNATGRTLSFVYTYQIS